MEIISNLHFSHPYFYFINGLFPDILLYRGSNPAYALVWLGEEKNVAEGLAHWFGQYLFLSLKLNWNTSTHIELRIAHGFLCVQCWSWGYLADHIIIQILKYLLSGPLWTSLDKIFVNLLMQTWAGLGQKSAMLLSTIGNFCQIS